MTITMKRIQKRCPHPVTEGPRAGEVCGRRYYLPHEGCERHRPKPATRSGTAPTPEQAAKADARARRRRNTAGIPAGWVV